MKKVKQFLNPIIILYLLCGVACGIVLGNMMDRIHVWEPVGGLILGLLLFYVVTIFEIVIHEGGHLVAGLLSGYRFVSFRVFSWLIAEEQGKLKLKRFSLAGTAGQCLLDPPELKDGAIPVKFYNLGGVLANIFTSVIGLICYILVDKNSITSGLWLMVMILGIGYALANGLPFSNGMVNNDGYNVRYLAKDPIAMKGFWTQLRVNAEQARGVALSDMPDAWFDMPSDEALKDAMTASQAVIRCNRFMEQQDFAGALDRMEALLGKDTAIMGLHRALLKSDCIYCRILLDHDKEEVRAMMDKEQQKIMKSMKGLPCIQRTEYAYALLVEGNMQKAEKIKDTFMKMEKSYPYKAEFESERSLLELAERAENKN
ncbi:MAG: M50 family metallopeptidase [Lachnospiraceae bacterium]|nr:M50 family metallopeptidase [Lachnospiraceae bacterium]